MTGQDRWRAGVAFVLLILGIVILVRAIGDPRAWPISMFGAVLVLFGLYRLNQVRGYLQSR